MKITREIELEEGTGIFVTISPGRVRVPAVEIDWRQAEKLASELMSASEAARALEELQGQGRNGVRPTEPNPSELIPSQDTVLSVPCDGPIRLDTHVEVPKVAKNLCSKCRKPLRAGAVFRPDGEGGFRHAVGSPGCE